MRISDWSSDVCSSDLLARSAEISHSRSPRRRDDATAPARRQFGSVSSASSSFLSMTADRGGGIVGENRALEVPGARYDEFVGRCRFWRGWRKVGGES